MIEIYQGKPGAGKSFHAVRKMIEYLSHGGFVCSNIKLNMPNCLEHARKYYGVEFDPAQYVFLPDEQITTFYKHTPQGTKEQPTLVMIDEAHFYFNARDWSKQSRELLNFLTVSRHCATDIIFISQHINNLDKQMVRLAQHVYWLRDMSRFCLWGMRIPLPYLLMVKYDYTGKEVLGRVWAVKNPDIFQLYESYEHANRFERLEGPNVKGVKKVTTGDKKYMFVGVLIGLVLGYVGAARIVNGSEPTKLHTGIATNTMAKNSITNADPELSTETNNQESITGYTMVGSKAYVYTSSGRTLTLGDTWQDSQIVRCDMEGAYLENGSNIVTVDL